jgi:hypothetical protein
MARLLLILANSLVPGLALMTHGRLVGGLALLVPALAGLSLWVVVAGPAGQPSAWQAGLAGVLIYLGCALAAALAWWRIAAHAPPDPAQVRALHRVVAAHYLRGEWPAALPAARRLARLAADEPGAWRMLELVAHGAGDARTARQAAARARRCQEDARV